MSVQKLKVIKRMVEWALDYYERARNDDKYLFNAILMNYYRDQLIDVDGKPAMLLKDIYDLPNYEHVIRARRKIQNPDPKRNYKGRFHPTDPDVLRKRGYMEEDMRKFLGYNPEMRKIYEVN